MPKIPQPKFKIIGVDNFDRDTVSDFLVCENMTETYAKRIVEFLNKSAGNNSSAFFKYAPMNHKLYEWEP